MACARLEAEIPRLNMTIFFPGLGVEGVGGLAFFTGRGVEAKPALPLGAEPADAPLEILIVFGVPPFWVPRSTDCFLFEPARRLSLIPDLGVAVPLDGDMPCPLVEMLSGGSAGGGI